MAYAFYLLDGLSKFGAFLLLITGMVNGKLPDLCKLNWHTPTLKNKLDEKNPTRIALHTFLVFRNQCHFLLGFFPKNGSVILFVHIYQIPETGELI